MNEYAVRINLKTDCSDRQKLIDFCLNNEKQQYLAIGWSYVYSNEEDRIKICSYGDYYNAVKNSTSRINHVLNVFFDAEKNDLFWTRDLEGYYWICRATGSAQQHFDESLDIGAVLPVEAYKVGLEVPGQIKASFNRPQGGTSQNINDKTITEYSKYIYNEISGNSIYTVNKIDNGVLNNLPDFELEELVIAYIQITENYYVLSNSIASKSTTVKIECELISRDLNNPRKGVVQVKGGNTATLDALDYRKFTDDGYMVYLYAPYILNKDKVKNIIEITKTDLTAFYNKYKKILPQSITKWENLFF